MEIRIPLPWILNDRYHGVEGSLVTVAINIMSVVNDNGQLPWKTIYGIWYHGLADSLLSNATRYA